MSRSWAELLWHMSHRGQRLLLPVVSLTATVIKHHCQQCCSFQHSMGLIFWGGGGGEAMISRQSFAHQKALEKSLGIKDRSCPVLQLSHKTVW